MFTKSISMKSCWTRLYNKLSKWRHHPTTTLKRNSTKGKPYGNIFLRSSCSSQVTRDQIGVQRDQQQRQSMYSCLASPSSTHPPMTMSIISDSLYDNDAYYNEDSNDDEEEQEDNNGSINTPVFSSTSNLSSSACYSNFYLKLNNGKYMVRVRTAERVIIGSYVIDEHMI